MAKDKTTDETKAAPAVFEQKTETTDEGTFTTDTQGVVVQTRS